MKKLLSITLLLSAVAAKAQVRPSEKEISSYIVYSQGLRVPALIHNWQVINLSDTGKTRNVLTIHKNTGEAILRSYTLFDSAGKDVNKGFILADRWISY